MYKIKAVCLAFLFFLALPCYLSAYDGDEVENYGRLRLLQQATGQPAASDTFETRVASILNPGVQATPAFESQAKTDQAIIQQVQMQEKESLLAQEKNLERNRKAALTNLPKNDNGLAGTSLAQELKMQPVTDQSKDQSSYLDASEETFQKMLEDKLRKQSEIIGETEFKRTAEEKKSQAPVSNALPPSLANNPFYFSGNSIQNETENFEANKPLILSRLIQVGVSVDDAEQMLSKASRPDDLILNVMENYGMSYGAAKDIADTQKNKKN